MLRTTVTGNTMIFKNDKGFYSTSLSKKIRNADGTDGGWDRTYVGVYFTDKADIPDRTEINITNGFLTFNNYVDQTGAKRTAYQVIVTEFTPVQNNANVFGAQAQQPVQPAQKVAQAKPNDTIGAISDDDLPF